MHEVFLQRPVTTREREKRVMRYLRLFWGPRAFRATRSQNGVATVWSITKNVSKVTFKLNTAGTFHDIRSYVILLKQSFRVIVFLIFKDYILYTSKVLAFSEVRQCMFWKIRKTDISVRKRLEPLSRRRQKERTIRGTIEPKKHAVNAKVCSGGLEFGCKFDKASVTWRAFHISR